MEERREGGKKEGREARRENFRIRRENKRKIATLR